MDRYEREQYLSAVRKFTDTPTLPGLNHEKMQGTEATYSIRASRGDRILMERAEDEAGVIWTFTHAGPHDDYRRLRR